MKCPNCGNRIPEGHLYCETCGKEINFVPEFDPEVENRINESLSGVADDLKDESIFYTKRLPGMKANKSDLKPFVIPAITGIAVVVAFIVVLLFILDGRSPMMSNEDKAESCYVSGDFQGAIEAIDEAIEDTAIDDIAKRSELLFKKYGYQKEAGLDEAATDTLITLADEKMFDDQTVVTATGYLIENYEAAGNYEAIYELLTNTGLSSVKEKYAAYLPKAPTISPEGGDFDEPVNVRITGDSNGKIYYTINGSDPDEKSELYKDEIILEEEGDYNIRAVFINDYGIKSEIVKYLFHLENLGPEAPVIMEDSGDYSQSTMIVAVCDPGCRIFYTTDGTDPTDESKEYLSPIAMPIGTTTFKFVTADAEGNLSDVVERNYHLSYATLVSVDQAKQSIIAILLKLDILLDSTGKMRGEEGYFEYVYNGVIEIEGSGEYYKFTETHVYNDGHTSDTGLLYAVNTHDGKVNRLGYDSSGKYTLITISNR